MKVEIISPDKIIFSGDLKLVKLPGIDGFFEIMENHAPLISVLKKGQIKTLTASNQENFIEINGGVVEVVNNSVKILAE